jgi:uroporphyrin-3 C-methyltransferase
LAGLSLASMGTAWTLQMRLKRLEAELVQRQQSSQDQAGEARLMAKQARDASAEVSAKLALLDARVAESALQRSQVEELISSLSRSRDENVLADVEAALRVAQQQSSITGSAEPLMAALRQAEERLARYNQPRLERVRRAVARDLDRVRAVALVDLPSLSIRLDEAVRLIDELPMLSTPVARSVDSQGSGKAPAPAASPKVNAASASKASASGWGDWSGVDWAAWSTLGGRVWAEVRTLVRVTPIERPEAMLISPEQRFFLRENLKLRLLNARLALLSRQFEQAQTDLNQAQQALERYFDRDSRRVVVALDLVRLVNSQSRQVALPRPDETLAALATAAAGR